MDVSENVNKKTEIEGARAVLVALQTRLLSAEDVEKSLDELSRLLSTAGGEVFAKVVQAKETPDTRTVVGSGKVREIGELCSANDIHLVIFDCELSPSQIRNLEDGMGKDAEVRVIDRSMLILDIFALHALTGEGKLQVELAQLKYTAPRLSGRGAEMSRLGGGIGTRGPGETKLESDRRHMKRRIAALEAELDELDRTRKTMRAARDRSGTPKAAIVGYTNAGKSTLLNRLTDAGILAEDKLFATLDPTTRRFTLPCGESVLLTDTVGFIRKLPHHLVKAFKSTLDEAVYADILLVLADVSDSDFADELDVTDKLLEELGASGKPTLYLLNKCDKAKGELPVLSGKDKENVFYISAKSGKGIDEMIARLEALVQNGKKRLVFTIPNTEQGALNTLYKNASVENVEYGAEAVKVTAVVDAKTRGMLGKYLPECERIKKETEFDL